MKPYPLLTLRIFNKFVDLNSKQNTVSCATKICAKIEDLQFDVGNRIENRKYTDIYGKSLTD